MDGIILDEAQNIRIANETGTGGATSFFGLSHRADRHTGREQSVHLVIMSSHVPEPVQTKLFVPFKPIAMRGNGSKPPRHVASSERKTIILICRRRINTSLRTRQRPSSRHEGALDERNASNAKRVWRRCRIKQVIHPAQFLGDNSAILPFRKLARLTEMLEEVLVSGNGARLHAVCRDGDAHQRIAETLATKCSFCTEVSKKQRD